MPKEKKGMQRKASGRALVGRCFDPNTPIMDYETDTPKCGAHCRTTGKPCTAYAMENGRCRMHGGNNNASTNPAKHNGTTRAAPIQYGIYADVGLLDDEYTVYPGVVQKLGTLDEELHMARIKLRRVYKAQAHWERVRDDMARVIDDPDSYLTMAKDHGVLELDELETKAGTAYVPSGVKGVPGELEDVATTRMKRKIHDYAAEILKFSNMIRNLETARVELLAGGTGGEDYVRQLSEDLRDFDSNATGSNPGGAAWGAGNYDD